MSSKIIQVDPSRPDPLAIERAAEILQRGGLVIFPTDTVYGLGCLAGNAEATERIFRAKGRPRRQPLILLIGDGSDLVRLGESVPDTAQQAAARFWPGPLTIVVKRSQQVPVELVAGGETVGIRLPNHPVALALISRAASDLASTSANRSGGENAITAEDAFRQIGSEVDLVLDAGPASLAVPSTVVDFTTHPPKMIREGALSWDQLKGEI